MRRTGLIGTRFASSLPLIILIFLIGVFTAAAQESPEPVATPDPSGVTVESCRELTERTAGALSIRTDAVAPFFIGLGDAAFADEDYTPAIEAYSCAILADPTYAPAFMNRGYAFFAQRADPLALADFNRAVELDPALALAYNYRGMLYTVQGNFGLALGDFTVALTLNPDDASAYNNRAVVHAAEGNYDLAMFDIDSALLIDPEYPAVYATRSAIYTALALIDAEAYRSRAGEAARYPNGSPIEVMGGLESAAETGSFATWLAFLTRR